MIPALNEAGNSWADAVLRSCLHGAILAVAVALVCWIWRKMPAGLKCALWCAVFAKMLLTLIPTAVPLAVLPAAPIQHVVIEPALGPSEVLTPVVDSAAVPAPVISLAAWLMLAWGVGVTWRIAATLCGVARVRRIARDSEPGDASLATFCEATGGEIRLRRTPQVCVTRRDAGAFVYGWLRPRLVVSRRLLDECTLREVKLVLTHELHHVKRHDSLLGLLPQFVQTLFFFNPVVWFACREFEAERELACDEATLRMSGYPGNAYAQLLVKVGTATRAGHRLYSPGVSSHFRSLRRRITMLNTIDRSNRPRPFWRALPIACLAAACLVPLTLVEAQAPSSPAKHPAMRQEANHSTAASKTVTKRAKRGNVTILRTRKNKVLRISTPEPKPLVWTKTSTVYTIASQGRDRGSSGFVRVIRLHSLSGSVAAKKVIEKFHSARPLDVYVDKQMNAIVVRSNDELFGKIEKFLNTLDQAPSGPSGSYGVVGSKLGYSVTKNGTGHVTWQEPKSATPVKGSAYKIHEKPTDYVTAGNSVTYKIYRAPSSLKGTNNYTIVSQSGKYEKPGESTITKVTQAGTPYVLVAKYKLVHGSARDIVAGLKDEIAKQKLHVAFVSYDPTDNSVLVQADEEVLRKVADIIRKLDR